VTDGDDIHDICAMTSVVALEIKHQHQMSQNLIASRVHAKIFTYQVLSISDPKFFSSCTDRQAHTHQLKQYVYLLRSA